jgi:hypothetical protein
MLHVLFLGLATITVIPTLPPAIDLSEAVQNEAVGYFPLSLGSSSFPLQPHGSVVSFVFYAAVVLSGVNFLLGTTSTVRMIVITAWPRFR